MLLPAGDNARPSPSVAVVFLRCTAVGATVCRYSLPMGVYRKPQYGTFTNIAVSSNVTGIGSRSRGSYAVDYDNDGDLDLFVASNFKDGFGDPNLLYRNDGNFQFTDVAPEAGIAREGIGNWAAAWTDYDRDGLIDFFITTPESHDGGPPASALYRNRGDGTFEDVSSAAGIDTGFSNSGAWGDFNNDGYPDLFVAMDIC